MSIAISVASAAIAILSLLFAIHSWREANRPLVSIHISTFSGGNISIPLNIVVENTGNRPAKNIRLVAKKSEVLAALSTPSEMPKCAERCFFRDLSIPLLIHGRVASNAFGLLGNAPEAWCAGAEIPVKVLYEDLNGRRFSSKLRLLLADDAGFAQIFWAKTRDKDQ